ncbi:hypothetical protein NITHO_3430022 [Nitrolancea hollandica Lb]|uniref:Uncharacterized protein n=1 Tax=Nitrolancea hollandica Lb TaxID=1129897 RepID=I4EIG5_9BACT|nr:hypothetical protein NITHO_3430022 [Nitrolancea hollandica Lb]
MDAGATSVGGGIGASRDARHADRSDWFPADAGSSYFALLQSISIPPSSPITMSATIRFMIMSTTVAPASLLPAERATVAESGSPRRLHPLTILLPVQPRAIPWTSTFPPGSSC